MKAASAGEVMDGLYRPSGCGPMNGCYVAQRNWRVRGPQLAGKRRIRCAARRMLYTQLLDHAFEDPLL
jgi:hypothetical protein